MPQKLKVTLLFRKYRIQPEWFGSVYNYPLRSWSIYISHSLLWFFFLWLDQTTSYLASCSMHALFFPCYLLQATFPTGTLLSLAAAWKPYFFLPCFLFNFGNTVSLPFRLKQPKEKNTVFCFSKNSQSAIEITFYFLLHTNPAKVICNSIKADLPKTYQKETYKENTQTFPSHLCIPAFEKNRFQFLFQD